MRNIFYGFLMCIYKYFSRNHVYKKAHTLVDIYGKTNGKFISIGSGGGWSKVIKNKMKLNVTEVDKDEKRLPDIVANMEVMSFASDSSIDAIFCFEVLEHVENINIAIAEAWRILKPGAYFYGSTPFSFPLHDEPYDFARYSKYGLVKLFNKFEIVTLQETSNYLETISLSLIRLIILPGLATKLVGFFFFPLALFLRLSSFLVKTDVLPTGYIFVFRKPE
ncbi:MAG: methyltransferase domain-containing protein [Pseudobdellovibrionaceae bacterium]